MAGYIEDMQMRRHIQLPQPAIMGCRWYQKSAEPRHKVEGGISLALRPFPQHLRPCPDLNKISATRTRASTVRLFIAASMKDENGLQNNASAVEQRSIARGDPRWLQLVYRNSQLYVDMIRTFPRLLKAAFPLFMVAWLSSLAVTLSDFGSLIVNFAGHPTVGGFLSPVVSLLGWLLVLQGSLVLLIRVSQAIFARSSWSTKTDKQAIEEQLRTGTIDSLTPLAERDSQVVEGIHSPVFDGQKTIDPLRRPSSRGQTLWILACLIISQLGVILGFFVPCILLMHLERYGVEREDAFSIFDVFFLLSSLLALVLATELLAWAFFFVLITIAYIVCDPGTLQPESLTEC